MSNEIETETWYYIVIQENATLALLLAAAADTCYLTTCF
jgi:hypothetical protein